MGGGEKNEDGDLLETLHESVASLFGGSSSMDKTVLYEKLQESTWSEILQQRRAIERVVHGINRLPIARVMMHSAMPMIAFQIGVFYLYADGAKATDGAELPVWMRHVIVYGDAERYSSIKRLALEHGRFFMAL